MPVPEEYSKRRAADELLCLTPDAVREFRPRPLHELAAEAGARRASEARRRLAVLSPEERRRRLRGDWARLLGDVEPEADPKVRRLAREVTEHATVERIVLEVGRGVVVPVLLLVPPPGRRFVRPWCWASPRRASRPSWPSGRGRSRSGSGAGRRSAWSTCVGPARRGPATARGGTTAPRPRSPRPSGCSARRSSAPGCATSARSCATCGPAPTSTPAGWPCGAIPSPRRTPRIGPWRSRWMPTLTLTRPSRWGACWPSSRPCSRTASAPSACAGASTGFESLLEGQFLYVPHDALIPGALTAGDLSDVAASLAPRPLRMEGLVDGLDRAVGAVEMARVMEPARSAYRALDAGNHLRLGEVDAANPPLARWLLESLVADPAP